MLTVKLFSLVAVIALSVGMTAPVQAISLEQAIKDALQTSPELMEQNQQYLISEQVL